MKLRLKKSLTLFAIGVLTLFLNMNMSSAAEVVTWTESTTAIAATITPNII